MAVFYIGYPGYKGGWANSNVLTPGANEADRTTIGELVNLTNITYSANWGDIIVSDDLLALTTARDSRVVATVDAPARVVTSPGARHIWLDPAIYGSYKVLQAYAAALAVAIDSESLWSTLEAALTTVDNPSKYVGLTYGGPGVRTFPIQPTLLYAEGTVPADALTATSGWVLIYSTPDPDESTVSPTDYYVRVDTGIAGGQFFGLTVDQVAAVVGGDVLGGGGGGPGGTPFDPDDLTESLSSGNLTVPFDILSSMAVRLAKENYSGVLNAFVEDITTRLAYLVDQDVTNPIGGPLDLNRNTVTGVADATDFTDLVNWGQVKTELGIS